MGKRFFLLLPLAAAAILAACGEETQETDDAGSGATSSVGSGGTPSVASGITSAGVGGTNDTGIACFGAYTNIPMGECDLLRQNCAGGMACEPIQMGANWTTQCVPQKGLKGAGDSCVNNDSCAGGLHCVFDRCSPICCPSSNEPCGVSGVCNVNTPFGQFQAQTCSYLESCNLFTGECGDSANCYPLMDDGNSVCAPITGPTNGVGGSCSAINECEDSMVCLGGTCTWACYLDGDALPEGQGGCPAGQTCVENGSNPPQNVGVCG